MVNAKQRVYCTVKLTLMEVKYLCSETHPIKCITEKNNLSNQILQQMT